MASKKKSSKERSWLSDLDAANKRHEVSIGKLEDAQRKLAEAEASLRDAKMNVERCKPLSKNEASLLARSDGEGCEINPYIFDEWGDIVGSAKDGESMDRLEKIGFVRSRFSSDRGPRRKVEITELGIQKLKCHRRSK